MTSRQAIFLDLTGFLSFYEMKLFFRLVGLFSEVNHGETPENVPTFLLAGHDLYC